MRRVICFFAFLAFAWGGWAATYTVTNTNDSGPGSFRDALNFCNGMPGRDTIQFSIPGIGPFVLQPQSPYPVLLDQGGVFIDGFSQAGAFPGTSPPFTANLQIVLIGLAAGPCSGLEIQSQGNTIRGLVISNFAFDGIRISANHPPTSNNLIYCNFIGTNVTGQFATPNGTLSANAYAGVYIRPSFLCSGLAHDNFIDANLISGNNGDGVAISSCPPNTDVFMNHVTRNLIGTDISGTLPLGNLHAGVYIGEGAHDNLVADNVICDNDYEGVSIIGYYQAGGPAWFTNNNHVADNLIGLAADGITALGNLREGVAIGVWGPIWKLGYAEHNDVQRNTIFDNGRNGILVWENPVNNANADFNWFSQNSIFSNALLGIDLNGDGVTPNDTGDPDNLANQETNFPVIASAVRAQGVTAISGTLDIGGPAILAVVEVFLTQSNPANPGYGQGKTFLGSTNPDAAGNWSVSLPGLSVGDSICATATNPTFSTSEFSANTVVTRSTEVADATAENWILSPTMPNPVQDYACWNLNLKNGSFVSLHILNQEGQLVSRLHDGWLAAGQYTFVWDGLDDRGNTPSPGLYLVQLQAGQNATVRSLLKL